MIGRIEGIVSAKRPGFTILSAGGVGYKVAVTREALAAFVVGQNASLWTHLVVREDALDLYGFKSEDELHFFELLLTVSGVGPKSALAILDIAPVETLRSAIAQGNAQYLTKVSGVGRKTADKIVFELREKVGANADGSAALQGDEDALEAMRSLGYPLREARDALRKVPHEITNGSDRLREALKILGAK
ncbi:Holliday junction DNA helicase RuvA [Candidatus Kaiserbacteria bacterium RIFCSPHIGHO2_01_FULL_55_17]|uniref:Holliday junction branch migration complex subunit RuvA n=1 Tax=Candidatus Kaiserbacteria bacterium RIFCSPHIGHO2_01_FULL_55_17 TaxID=1798484 RepID=A0A1F6D925_9BACT|nr:MAG: Holliday junction DNA helicase RuvA [Candidatus Kaiserbacteria bacterium RIFCSPHIGHO2_01_FULL_55_17]